MIPKQSVRYVPWPEDGCTLGEARERTVDRALWNSWRTLVDRRRQVRKAADLERVVNTRFQEMLRQGRLVAIGRPASAAAETVIDREFWSSSIISDWTVSAATADQHCGRAFHAVRVFPIVHGPTRIDAPSGLTIVEAMRRYVLDDPEVVALSVPALEVDPGLDSVLKRGLWTFHGAREWPLQVSDVPLDGGEDEYLFGWAMNFSTRSDSPHPYLALRAFEDRVEGLLKLFREGSLAVEGLPLRPGDPVRVPRSVWSHHAYSLNLERGDLYEENDRPEHEWDRKIKRWSALMICRGDITVVPQIGPLEPSTQVISAEVVMAPPSPRRSRPQPKSDGVRAALKAAGIDLATDPRSASAIAADIVDLLPWPVSQGHQLAALVKTVIRLKRQLA